MVFTASTDIAQQILLSSRSDPDTRVITGKLSEDMDPGSWVAFDGANDQWIPLDTDTSGHAVASGSKVGVVLYRQRVKPSTNAERLITDDYDVSEAEGKKAPIAISGTVVCKIVDQNASRYVGDGIMASATAETATYYDVAAVTGASGGTALQQAKIGEFAMEVVDGDTWAIANIGKAIGNGAQRSRIGDVMSD
jgi:hypothetical protein